MVAAVATVVLMVVVAAVAVGGGGGGGGCCCGGRDDCGGSGNGWCVVVGWRRASKVRRYDRDDDGGGGDEHTGHAHARRWRSSVLLLCGRPACVIDGTLLSAATVAAAVAGEFVYNIYMYVRAYVVELIALLREEGDEHSCPSVCARGRMRMR